jgi:hypothetical protein
VTLFRAIFAKARPGNRIAREAMGHGKGAPVQRATAPGPDLPALVQRASISKISHYSCDLLIHAC